MEREGGRREGGRKEIKRMGDTVSEQTVITSSVTVLTFLLNHPDNAHTTAALAALPAR